MSDVHICSFTAGSPVNRKTRYEDLKAEIVRVGKFSCFEATANGYAAGMFTRLCRDPEIEVDHVNFAYPWTGIKLRAPRPAAER